MRYRIVQRDVWLYRWGVVGVFSGTLMGRFLTRRGAERWIRANTWTEAD